MTLLIYPPGAAEPRQVQVRPALLTSTFLIFGDGEFKETGDVKKFDVAESMCLIDKIEVNASFQGRQKRGHRTLRKLTSLFKPFTLHDKNRDI